jgi:glutathione synthase/RimK-type ligase-like ATP-grasp enzyme
MSVLIITNQEDLHAWALRWALRSVGVETYIVSTRCMPEGTHVSMSVSSESEKSELSIVGCSPFADVSSIWIRRADIPEGVSPRIEDSDRQMALIETHRFVNAIRHFLGTSPICVNPNSGRVACDSKFYQLRIAQEVGFSVPDTLMSNDPREIRAFSRRHNGAIVHKPFHPASWSKADGTGFERSFTSQMTLEHLLVDDVAFTSCPGIYQEIIQKSCEYRVTFFGQQYFSMRIFTQEVAASRVDSRADFEHRAPVDVGSLPDSCIRLCKELSSRLGIMHGSFDLIETPDGDIVFLEVNEMGQFLFMEEWVPELQLLAAATQFAISPSPDFLFSSQSELSHISFQAFLASKDYVEFSSVWSKYVKAGRFLFTYKG